MLDISKVCKDTTEGYATFLYRGIDTIQECYCTEFPVGFSDRLDDGQNLAREKHEGQGTSFIFNGELFQIWSGGSKGNRWVIEDEDFQFHFRTDKAGWNVSVRYKAEGLAGKRLTDLKSRVYDLLGGEGFKQVYNNPDINPSLEWERLSRIDYALDFHSPNFSVLMKDGNVRKHLLLTSGVKGGLVFDSQRDQTITIGIAKTPSVQVQVYDKGREIAQASGKTWMFNFWYEQAGYIPPMQENGKRRAFDVWRVEIRLYKDYLRERGIVKWDDFDWNMNSKDVKFWPILAEALDRRRMIIPKIDGKPVKNENHKERWDYHPLWAEVYSCIFAPVKFVPRQKVIAMSRSNYIDMLAKQEAGIGRSKAIAEYGAYDPEQRRIDAARSVDLAVSDKRHADKVDKCMERQRFMDDEDENN